MKDTTKSPWSLFLGVPKTVVVLATKKIKIGACHITSLLIRLPPIAV